jgi:hypothetical protein
MEVAELILIGVNAAIKTFNSGTNLRECHIQVRILSSRGTK